jgi:hypothetical protein
MAAVPWSAVLPMAAALTISHPKRFVVPVPRPFEVAQYSLDDLRSFRRKVHPFIDEGFNDAGDGLGAGVQSHECLVDPVLRIRQGESLSSADPGWAGSEVIESSGGSFQIDGHIELSRIGAEHDGDGVPSPGLGIHERCALNMDREGGYIHKPTTIDLFDDHPVSVAPWHGHLLVMKEPLTSVT